VLSLQPLLFGALTDIPARCTMGVSRLNTGAISREALRHGRAGFSGHYALVGAGHIAAQHAAGQAVGCGFPASRAVLYREIGRGVDWVFTNRAREAERWRREALAAAPAAGSPAPPR
jgi:glycerophosphoryl diester phosphodiesterase